MQETWVPSLGQEDSMEKGVTTHSSILAWRIPWTEESGGYSPCGCKESDTIERLTDTHTHTGWGWAGGRTLVISGSKDREKPKRQGIRLQWRRWGRWEESTGSFGEKVILAPQDNRG